MNEIYYILLLALGVCVGAYIAFKISQRETENLVLYDEEGIPRILDLSDPYIRIAYVAIGIAGPKNWEPKTVRRIALRIAQVLQNEDHNFDIRDKIKAEITEELDNGLCPDCGAPLNKDTKLVAGESLDILKCPDKSCNWEGFFPVKTEGNKDPSAIRVLGNEQGWNQPDSYKCPGCGHMCNEDNIDSCETLQCPKCGKSFTPEVGDE